MQPIDLNLAEALDALIETGSVTGAAKKLGASTPAMSRTLARIRAQVGDPILVRAGRGMVLTPRAEALRDRVRLAVQETRAVLSPERPFRVAELERTFVIRATDHVLTVLGAALDRRAAAEAPRVALRFMPNTTDDATPLRSGAIDLAIGIYGDLPPELMTRRLFSDRFVCVVRKNHPRVGKKLTLARYLELEHVQIAPRGVAGGYLDDLLAEQRLSRRVARAVPYFLAGLMLVARTDYVVTISERIARAMLATLDLELFEPPLAMKPYVLSMLWHPRMEADAAHRWLRELLVRAAKEAPG